MVFGLGSRRGSRAKGCFSFANEGRSTVSTASTTDRASHGNTTLLQGLSSADDSIVKPQEVTPPQDVSPKSPQVLDSSLDQEALGEAFRAELDNRKAEGLNAIGSAEETKKSINIAIVAGQRAFDDKKESAARHLRHEEEALKLLTEHGSSLEELKKSLDAQATSSRDKVVRDNTTSKKLEMELAVAEEAVAAARAKADEARQKRAENVASNVAAVAQADDRVVTVKAQMAAAAERHKTTEASLALMRTHIVEAHEKAAACEREKNFVLEAMESVGKEKDVAEDAKQKASDLSVSSAAALKVHVEDSERRILGHEAELHRCQTRLQAAERLRDLCSRSSLHDGDSLNLEKARSNAKFAADQAAAALESEQQALRATKDADQARTTELATAAEKAALHLSQRELATQAVASRYDDRKKAAFNARALHSAAIAEHDVVSQEVKLAEQRVSELQEAKAALTLQVEDAVRQAADALSKVAAEEMPLKHAEQAEAIVLQAREQELANVRRALEVARLGAKEAEADAQQLSAAGIDVSSVSADHGMVIGEIEVRLQEKEHMVQQAQIAREAAEKALVDAEAELAVAEEEVLPSSFAASDASGDPDSSAHQVSDGEAQKRKALALASVESHKMTLHTAQAEEELSKSALVSVRAELEKAQASAAAQSKAIKQMMTADLVQVEIADAARCRQEHSAMVAQLRAEEVEALEKWDSKKGMLNADLHRAEMSLRLAKEDLMHHDGVRDSFKVPMGRLV